MDKAWKRCERELAERLGGKRIPINGREECDIEHPWLAPEIKYRASLPEWFKAPLRQASVSARDKLAIVIWHEKGQRHEADTVVMKLVDFEEYFNPKGKEG